MKKLWLCILTVLCLCGATAFAACGIIKDVEDTPELPATYTVTVAVSDEGYGTVSRSSVTGIAKDTAVTVNGATLTIGETAITATPTAATAQYTYAFTGFTGTVDAVTENITVTANFSRTTNVYTVIWADEDGTAIDTDTNVAYGTVPTFDGTNPTKIATAQYTYTFAGWTPTVAAITGDTTYTATFTPVTREYDVIFQNEDGTELQNTKVAYGTTPAYNGETPEKTATADYIYEFNGWDGEIADVAGDATYTATYISLLILKTADDFVSNFNTEFYDDTANGGSMYAYHSFALNNDIDMAGKI
ncbi:MAG: hypothetical protein J5697_00420, partial [Clostridia bacterium]|nr:hypothetical protein [Clostridia bacterium]